MFSSWVLERIAIGDVHRLVKGSNEVGRHSSCKIRITDSKYVSRHHAEIEISNDDKRVAIKDLNSVNGLFINGSFHKSVTIILKEGDEIGIGTSLEFKDDDDELTLPIFRLDYKPIVRLKSNIQKATSKVSIPCKQIDSADDNQQNIAISTTNNISNTQPQIFSNNHQVVNNEPNDPTRASTNPRKNAETIEAHQSEAICAAKAASPACDAELKLLIAQIKGEKEDGPRSQAGENINQLNPSQRLPDELLIISDDEDFVLVKKQKSSETSVNSGANVDASNPTPNITAPIIEASSNNGCSQMDEQLPTNSSIPFKEEFMSEPSLDEPILISDDEDMPCQDNAKTKTYQDLSEGLPGTSIKPASSSPPAIHIPMLTSLKKERLEAITDTVVSIFGKCDQDDVVNEQLKEINPLLYNNLCGKPLLPVVNVENHMHNGELLVLSDDEFMDVVGTLEPAPTDTSNEQQRTELNQSPNVFYSSFNDSKEDEGNQHTDNTKNPQSTHIVDLDECVSLNEEVKEDEMIFSQVIMDDIKADLKDDDFEKNYEESPAIESPLSDCETKPQPTIKQELNLSICAPTAGSLGDQEWIEIDDEAYDEEFESKVNDWSNKIFSQSFDKIGMSQIYDREIFSDDQDDQGSDDQQVGSDAADDNVRSIADMYNGNCMPQQMPEVDADSSPSREELPKCATTDDSESKLNAATSVKSDLNEEKAAVSDANKTNEKTLNAVPPCSKAEDPCKKKLHKRSKSDDKDGLCKRSISEGSESTKGHTKSRVTNEPHSKNTSKGLSDLKRKTPLQSGIDKTTQHKWLEKSAVKEKRDKELLKKIREKRRDKLKDLATKSSGSCENSRKRKKSSGPEKYAGDIKAKKSKLLTEKPSTNTFVANIHKPGDKEQEVSSKFKTPLQSAKKVETAKKPDANSRVTASSLPKRSVSVDEQPVKQIKRFSSLDGTFSQQIAKPDDLLLKKKNAETKKSDHKSIPAKLPSPANTTGPDSKAVQVVCKEALAARACRTTNKITFASMEKNITETEACKQKLAMIANSVAKPPLTSSLSKGDASTTKTKKTVRFNDTPTIHYIERINGPTRRLLQKDIMPLTAYRDRQFMVRRTFPVIDKTDKIISQILTWSNEWLVKQNAAADAASDLVYPMPTSFSSFEHYKSIIFPLMKIEFASMLEREHKANQYFIKFTVWLEYVTENLDRIVLVTKYKSQNRKLMDSSLFDLVILQNKDLKQPMFAYLSSVRKSSDAYTMVYEISATGISKEILKGIKQFRVQPVIDNVRVELGAFNAVYQLEATPLFNRVLNPMELLKDSPEHKIPNYYGLHLLNSKQLHVLLKIYNRIINETTPNISLIQGPPGTGKSYVITNLALQTLYGEEPRYMDKKILICAQSNVAVDVIARKLYEISTGMRPGIRFRMIRYGLPDKIDPSVRPVSLTHLVEKEMLKKMQAENNNIPIANKTHLRDQIHRCEKQIADLKKRNIKGTVEEDILQEKQRELQMMKSILNQYARPEDERKLYSWFLTNAHIVCTTLSSCIKLSQYINYFDICIIDEATQCTEPWTLVPLRFGINSLVLVGDTQQLPATVLSKKANELGLGKSLFTRIQNCLSDVGAKTQENDRKTKKHLRPTDIIYSLQTQYRMHPEICGWPNKYFYKNCLINGSITRQYTTPLKPFSILNLSYVQDESCSDGKISNNLEAEFVAKLLQALDAFIPMKSNSYGVITPYAQHRETLTNAMRSLGLSDIMVNTIDSYQGLEKDVIVISNARTTGIGFLSNPQRLNVALTRPKKCLILCGNFRNVEIVPAWRCLLQNARERNLYINISENCVNDMQRNVISKIQMQSPTLI